MFGFGRKKQETEFTDSDEMTGGSEAEGGTPDEGGQAPKEAATRLQPYPAAMYRAAILFTLLAAVGGGYHVAKKYANPDGRNAEEMARDYLTYRHRMAPKVVGEITDEKVKGIAKNAICLANQMGHPIGDQYDPAQMPTPPKPLEKKDYKRESSDFFIDKHDPKDPQKYIYVPNFHDYVHEKLPFYAESTIKNFRGHPDYKDTMTWLTMDTKEFLASPLACVRNVAGECMKTWEGNDCLLLEPLAHAVSMANLEMFNDHKGEIIPMVCFRNFLRQAVDFAANSGHGCKVVRAKAGLMLPGNSWHGMGLAMDLANQGQAEDYLSNYNIACGFINGDEGHCSFGENSMTGNLNAIRGKLKKWGRKWKDAKDGYKWFKENK